MSDAQLDRCPGAESDILQKLNHKNIVDVKACHMWEKNKVLIIEEELLNGEELLDAAQEAIVQHGFTITESFAARVRPPHTFFLSEQSSFSSNILPVCLRRLPALCPSELFA